MTEIFIGEITDGAGDRFRRELAAAGDGPVTLRINSVGGIVDEALDMYRAIVDRGNVTAYVTGLAASAATIPLCGADTVRMADGAQIMTHAPSTEAKGDAAAFRRTAESLERTEQALLQLYMARTGRGEKEVLRLLATETYLSASEAKRLGFVDEIIPMRSCDLAQIDTSRLPHPPPVFVRAVAQARQNMAKANTTRQTDAAVDPQIVETLGLESDATLEMVLATIMALRDKAESQPAPEPAPAPAPEAAATPADEDPMMAAVAEMPPEQQAKVLAVHSRTLSRLDALEADARGALVEKVPANLRVWAKKQSVSVLRDFVASLPAQTPATAREPARTTDTAPAPADDAPTEAEIAVAKALGRPVDYVRRTPQGARR